jgi:ligand-binding SRPBCC domain-containing protein
MKHRLEFEQWVAFPLERVFAFFSNPENLPRLMPVASATRLIALNLVPPPETSAGVSTEKAAGVGSSIVTSFRVFPLLPLRRRWVARITEFEWNRYFADVQDEGPFESWHHRHEFESAVREGVGGTLMRDVIEYEIGLGLAGTVANTLFVRRQMENTFAQRQHILPRLLA